MTLQTEVMQEVRTFVSAQEVKEFCRERGIKVADLKFTDVPGTWQHFSLPVSELDDKSFLEGVGFDGSSIRGFQAIQESDMMLVPDLGTAVVDPVLAVPTITFVCHVRDPVSGEPYSRDPRYVARKAEAHLKASGVADVSYWGPELEHFIFDDVRLDQKEQFGYYFVDSDEGIWNSGRDGSRPNLGHRPQHKRGYFPVPPTDSLQDIRSECMLKMIEAGMDVEVHHHEVATAGQGEIDMRYRSLTRMADQVMTHKYIIKNVARMHGKTATFMPKPIYADNASGMHVHQSLWKAGENLFFSDGGYALTSDLCRWYIGGLFRHAAALMALVAPTTNSYERLVPGFEAPVNLVWSQRNRSAAGRIPVYTRAPAAKRLEFRPPDPTCNPYLAFAGMLMAGLDGIANRIEPGDPLDKDLCDLEPAEAARIEQVPGSLEEALRALERDHDFLLRGDVFTEDLVQTWLNYKWQAEVDPVRMRPHPYEFFLYYDA